MIQKMLKRKIIELIMIAVLISASCIFSPMSSEAAPLPEAKLVFEPVRTADGIDYGVYIDNAKYLSTLIFKMEFDAEKAGSMRLAENECFDMLHSEWGSENNHVSVKCYLGRTGQKIGFSSDDRIKAAVISVPYDISATGEISASVSNAICAGITQLGGSAVKGNAVFPDTGIKYVMKECSVLSFDKNEAEILSAKERTADVIYALYDENGKLTDTCKKTVSLNRGENKIAVNGIDYSNAKTVSVTVWDSIGSMIPLSDKLTINN